MFSWIGNALSGVASFFGEGVASIFNWLLSGLISVLGKVLRAFGGIFDLLDALWNFLVSVKNSLLGLVSSFFPWIPPEVFTVISLGLLAVLLAGIIKKVRGK